MSSNAAVIQFTQTLEATSCAECGIAFALPDWFIRAARNEGAAKKFYCPNGHSLSYTKSEADKVREELARVAASLQRSQNDAEFWRVQNTVTGRKLIAQRGVTTKLRKRISVGVCPCCQRTFKQLAAHMKTQHPDYPTTEAE